MIDWQNYPLTLSVSHVADILRIGKNSSYELFHRKDFPAVRIGKNFRVSRDAFRRWLEGQGEAQKNTR
ncbi:MAG: Helix-turn-helix domain protein [Pelotomaculum sp. PtaU1.Bin035]|nr:MAG: Helix-turn-helix domain protein [Pelotomaculum sp. PtaU1.Bin035]